MTAIRLIGRLLLLLLMTAAHALAAPELPASWAARVVAAAAEADPGERVVRLSAGFMATPYVANTLGGGPALPESLVVRLDAVDCFTLLDYVEAMRRSADPAGFRQQLIEVRYLDGRITWETRRHFFSDWTVAADGWVIDVTAIIGGRRTQTALKTLNRRGDGSVYLPGVAVRERTVHFIPTAAIDDTVLAGLRPGDYLGIYAAEPGLDVTHVGIVVPGDGRLLLRHASSRRDTGQVVDSDLAGYLRGKPGIVVFRPVNR